MMLKKHKSLLDIIILAALFAPSFMFIKIAVQDIEPITVIAVRIALASLFLLIVLRVKNISLRWNFNLFKHCFVLGFFANGFPFVCFSYSLTSVPTSISALINGLTPVATVLLANLFLEDERLNRNRALGVILGLAGFSVLFLPALFRNEAEFNLLGIFLSFIGSISYAVAAVYARKHVCKAPFLVAPTLQLLTSLIYLVPLAFIFEHPKDLIGIPFSAWAAVMAISLFGTALAFIMYHRIIAEHGATVLAMSTYLLPIFGTILGVIFLNETISVNFMFAALLILCGIGVINGLIPLPPQMMKNN